MQERRRHKRYEAHITLSISDLFNQDEIQVAFLGEPIQIVDISRDGIGFISKDIIPLHYYFNAMLDLKCSDNSILYCVVEIIRCSKLEDGTYNYGCQFIGMPPVLGYIFDEYAQKAKEV